MINLLIWIVFGALAGWIISLLVSTNNAEKSIRFVMFGIMGAIIGGVITHFLNNESITNFNASTVMFSVLSALILLAAVRKFSV